MWSTEIAPSIPSPTPNCHQRYSLFTQTYDTYICRHPNRLAAKTINTLNIERRLKKEHPADHTKDIT